MTKYDYSIFAVYNILAFKIFAVQSLKIDDKYKLRGWRYSSIIIIDFSIIMKLF